MLCAITLAAMVAVASGTSATTVLVTGASGRTGSAVYKLLQARKDVAAVRGLVRNVTQAKEVLGCDKCDASEGIFVGDVTKPDTLREAFAGVDALAIAVGAGGPNLTKAAQAPP